MSILIIITIYSYERSTLLYDGVTIIIQASHSKIMPCPIKESKRFWQKNKEEIRHFLVEFKGENQEFCSKFFSYVDQRNNVSNAFQHMSGSDQSFS